MFFRFQFLMLLILLIKCLSSFPSIIATSNQSSAEAFKSELNSSMNSSNHKPSQSIRLPMLQITAKPSSNSNEPTMNLYPFRTKIGNLIFHLRQHRTQMLIIPSLLRLVYQYRKPILDGLTTAYQALSSSPVRVASSGLSSFHHSDRSSAIDSESVSFLSDRKNYGSQLPQTDLSHFYVANAMPTLKLNSFNDFRPSPYSSGLISLFPTYAYK